jgi:hypothetical protein
MNNETMKQKDFFGLTAGLSGSWIKVLGVIMMVFDHLYVMFNLNGAPYWFHWIGRPVAPMFLFMCAEGFAHTRSRKWYILRLLTGFELMNVISGVLSSALPNENIALMFSIFGSLFFAALYMLLSDMLVNSIKAKKAGRAALAALLMLIPIAYGLITLVLMSSDIIAGNIWLLRVLYQVIPNIIAIEGGFLWPLLGLLFYALRRRRLLQIIPLLVFGLVFAVFRSAEWLIILAGIPVLLYNGSRGRGGKYFFYIFYPAHIYLFYIIAYFLQRN